MVSAPPTMMVCLHSLLKKFSLLTKLRSAIKARKRYEPSNYVADEMSGMVLLSYKTYYFDSRRHDKDYYLHMELEEEVHMEEEEEEEKEEMEEEKEDKEENGEGEEDEEEEEEEDKGKEEKEEEEEEEEDKEDEDEEEDSLMCVHSR